jgi:hypothetical protein
MPRPGRGICRAIIAKRARAPVAAVIPFAAAMTEKIR